MTLPARFIGYHSASHSNRLQASRCKSLQSDLVPMVCQKTTTVPCQASNDVSFLGAAIAIEFNCICLGQCQQRRQALILRNLKESLTSILASPSASDSIGGIGFDGSDCSNLLSG